MRNPSLRSLPTQLKLLPNDTIIYSSKPIPGNEQFINRYINMLMKSGANVIKNNPLYGTHTTGHASVDEIKLMFSLMKPKYFMPVHGEYNMLKQHANIAVEMGVKKENCFCLDCGDVLTFKDKGHPKVVKQGVYASDIYLDSNFSDVDSNILKERKKMADEGLLSITFTVSKSKRLIGNVLITSKGFTDFEVSRSLENSIRQKALDIFNNVIKNSKTLNAKSIEKQLIVGLNQYIYQKIERKPLIVPIINIINKD